MVQLWKWRHNTTRLETQIWNVESPAHQTHPAKFREAALWQPATMELHQVFPFPPHHHFANWSPKKRPSISRGIRKTTIMIPIITREEKTSLEGGSTSGRPVTVTIRSSSSLARSLRDAVNIRSEPSSPYNHTSKAMLWTFPDERNRSSSPTPFSSEKRMVLWRPYRKNLSHWTTVPFEASMVMPLLELMIPIPAIRKPKGKK